MNKLEKLPNVPGHDMYGNQHRVFKVKTSRGYIKLIPRFVYWPGRDGTILRWFVENITANFGGTGGFGGFNKLEIRNGFLAD